VVSASKPLKQLGFVSRQANIGDALNEHNIYWAYYAGGFNSSLVESNRPLVETY
jgi:hypothetical protein